MSDEFTPMLPPLDDAKVEEMIGKVVLVGVTRYGGDGQVQGLEQYAGTVLRISADEGVVLADENDGHERYLPPMLDQYLPGGKPDSTSIPADETFTALRALGVADTTLVDSLAGAARARRMMRARQDSAFVDTLQRAIKDDSTRAAVRALLSSRSLQSEQADSGLDGRTSEGSSTVMVLSSSRECWSSAAKPWRGTTGSRPSRASIAVATS